MYLLNACALLGDASCTLRCFWGKRITEARLVHSEVVKCFFIHAPSESAVGATSTATFPATLRVSSESPPCSPFIVHSYISSGRSLTRRAAAEPQSCEPPSSLSNGESGPSVSPCDRHTDGHCLFIRLAVLAAATHHPETSTCRLLL